MVTLKALAFVIATVAVVSAGAGYATARMTFTVTCPTPISKPSLPRGGTVPLTGYHQW